MGNSSQSLARSLIYNYPYIESISRTATDEEFFVLNDRDYNYYAVDINIIDVGEIEQILLECEEIERKNWNAQEDFFEYIKKCDALLYAEKDGKIVGFLLVSLWPLENYWIFSLEEGIVLKEFRGNHIGRKLSALAARLFYLRVAKMKEVKKVVFMAASCNPRMLNGLLKNRRFFKLVRNTFRPSKDLLKIHDTYLARKNYSLVHRSYPFFIKNCFPGSHKYNKFDNEFKFSERFRKILPPGFDCIKRGDIFSFMAIVSKISAWPIVAILMQICFGREFWFNKKIGLLGNKKNRPI